ALQETVEDFAPGASIGSAFAVQGQLMQIGAVMIELSQITLQKTEMLRIERFQVTIKKLDRNCAIEPLLRVMSLLKQAGRDERNPPIRRPGRQAFRARALFRALRQGRFLVTG